MWCSYISLNQGRRESTILGESFQCNLRSYVPETTSVSWEECKCPNCKKTSRSHLIRDIREHSVRTVPGWRSSTWSLRCHEEQSTLSWGSNSPYKWARIEFFSLPITLEKSGPNLQIRERKKQCWPWELRAERGLQHQICVRGVFYPFPEERRKHESSKQMHISKKNGIWLSGMFWSPVVAISSSRKLLLRVTVH